MYFLKLFYSLSSTSCSFQYMFLPFFLPQPLYSFLPHHSTLFSHDTSIHIPSFTCSRCDPSLPFSSFLFFLLRFLTHPVISSFYVLHFLTFITLVPSFPIPLSFSILHYTFHVLWVLTSFFSCIVITVFRVSTTQGAQGIRDLLRELL